MSGRRRNRGGATRGRRRRQGRRQGNSVSRTTVGVVNAGRPLSGMFMPPVFRTSLRFVYSRSAAASTSLGQIAFSGNNVQDPGLSTGAEQPPGFTALATLYSRYRVIGSHAELRATMASTTAGGGLIASGDVCLYPSNSSGAPADFEAASSQPLAQWRELTSSTPQFIKRSMNTATMVGQQGMISSDRLQSLVSTAPSEEWYWQVVFQSDANFTASTLEWHIQITYDVEFFDRPTINQALDSWKHIQLAYRARCREIKAEQEFEQKRRQDRADSFLSKIEKEHLEDITRELKEIDAYQKLHKTFEPADYKDSVRGPVILDNATMHEKWLKLREVDDQLPRETPKSRPPSKK